MLRIRPNSSLHAVLALLALSIGCGTGSSDNSSDGNNTTAESGFSQSDIAGHWVGTLSPYDPEKEQRLFYVCADQNGNLVESVDSMANQWYEYDATLGVEMKSSGELLLSMLSNFNDKNLLLHGKMSRAMNRIVGEYEFSTLTGQFVTGYFEMYNSDNIDVFSNFDFSGSWSGGFGIGRLKNKRLLTFNLDEYGNVLSGTLVNTETGNLIHNYSAGAGQLVIDDIDTGKIRNFTVVADDGAIAECEYLLVDINQDFIAGTGIDSVVGAAMIEIRR